MTIRDHAPKSKDKKFDRDEWQTPPELFEKLNKRFNFDTDACATKKNALCDFFWTKKDDSLKQDWSGHRLFCNPPYSDIGSFIEKAAFHYHDTLVVLLVPAWTDRKWWHQHIERYRFFSKTTSVEFLPGRIKFLKDGKPVDSAPFPSCLVIFGDQS